MTGPGSSEIALVERLRRRASIPRGSRLIAGIGDDCAIFRPRGSPEDLLFTTDMLIEDVHFRRSTHPPEAAGHKALARGLSDMAAMGGEPRFCLLSLALPEWADAKWVERFYTGLLKLADRTGAPLAGGDLAKAARMTCDVVVCGAVPRGKALMRSGARPGDRVFVSGLLGASALGLSAGRGPAWKRHLYPEPRLELGRALRGRASSVMDLSDGLSLDLRRLCLASGVAAAIVEPPLYPGATLEHGLHGGEDYELLFTLPGNVKAPRGFEVSEIGVIQKGRPGRVTLSGRPLAALGYDHFAKT